jgi:hypothetical protein
MVAKVDRVACRTLARSLIAESTMDGLFVQRFAGRLERGTLHIGNVATASIEVHLNSVCNLRVQWLASLAEAWRSAPLPPRDASPRIISPMLFRSPSDQLSLTALSMSHQP